MYFKNKYLFFFGGEEIKYFFLRYYKYFKVSMVTADPKIKPKKPKLKKNGNKCSLQDQ